MVSITGVNQPGYSRILQDDIDSYPLETLAVPGGRTTGIGDEDHDSGIDPSEQDSEGDELCFTGEPTYSIPSAEELNTLRRVAGHIPWSAYVIALVELAERSSYFGCLNVLPNFIQRPLPTGSATGASIDIGQTPGALGRGLKVATVVITLFNFLAYLWPIAGGLIADLKLNKFRTIVLGAILGLFAHIILVYSSLPSVISTGGGFTPLILSLALLSFSTGLMSHCISDQSIPSISLTILSKISNPVKSNIAPMLCDQIPPPELSIKTLPTGEKVIVDRKVSVQQAMGLFYAFINIGAFVSVPTTFAEKYVGFWLAFTLPTILYIILPILLLYIYPTLTITPPQGSVLVQASRVLRIVWRSDGNVGVGGDVWENAKPGNANRVEDREGMRREWDWDDEFVDELKKAVRGCKIFLFFPLYYLNMNGLSSLVISQAASMSTNGIPNDVLSSINPLTIIIVIPILNYIIWPALRARNIQVGPVRRVVLGFLVASLGYFWAGWIQWKVYRTSPCGWYATACSVGTGVSPLSFWMTLPIPIMGGIGETLANVAGLEIAYNQAPQQLKSFVTALFLSCMAVSSAIVLAMIPMFSDPYLIWPFVGVATSTVTAAFFVNRIFSHMDQEQISDKGVPE